MSEIVQGTDAWKQIRLGKVTASRVADVVARTKSGWGASRASYMGQLIAERLSGICADGFTNAAMQHGTEYEPEARRAYEFRHDVDVAEIAFVPHPTIAMSGASPDGLVGDVGLVEIKCPATHTHIETLLGQKVPDKYRLQMLWQMACTGRRYCDFVSYDPRMPESMRMFIARVDRDDEAITQLEKDVIEFLAELDAKLAQLQAAYGLKEAA